jgi:predicted transcriptional regulator of viral defense system
MQLAEGLMGIERRENGRRAEVVRAVVDHVVHKAETTVTLNGLQDFLHVPPDAANRILSSLVSAGIVREVREGVWSRVPELPTSSF